MSEQASGSRIAEQLRAVYDAAARDAGRRMLALSSDDAVFHVPGQSPLAGAYAKATVNELLEKMRRISAGSFREEVIDVLAGETHAAVLLMHSLVRRGRPLSYTSLHLWTLRGERFCERRELPLDLAAFDSAWSEPAAEE